MKSDPVVPALKDLGALTPGDVDLVERAQIAHAKVLLEQARTSPSMSETIIVSLLESHVWMLERRQLCRQKADLLLQPLRDAARELGYAISVHGSLTRDIDLIACPWTEHAASAHELAAAVIDTIKTVNGIALDPTDDANPRTKPHGRLAWSIHLGGGPYVDLSVMPRLT
ncbi:MAG TPA: hypothetical protein VF422_06315 [Dokdonella sp.]